MNGKVTYHQQVSYCGKPRCRKCREGTGHGPYWYAYQTVDGRTTRTYIGKHLPVEVQAAVEGEREQLPSHDNEREEAIIRIYVLGQFRLERRDSRDGSEWQTVTDSAWQHQRVRALLACLVSSPGRKLGREQILDAIWPDLDVETASARLDRAVYSLRQLFEPSRTRLATSPLLLTEREVLVLAEQPQIWIDADAFEQLLVRARASDDPGEKEHVLEEAMMLYGGDLLPEVRRLEWTLARRESLLRSWIGLLLDLSDLRIARESLNSAIEPLDRLLSVDPTNEAAVQRLISLLAQLGRRGEALRAYKRLATVLQQEYRIAPLPETRALYDAVRQGVDKSSTRAVRVQGESHGLAETAARADRSTGSDTPVVQIGRMHQSPLVGREQEIELLHTLITTTENVARFKLAAQKRSFAAALDPQRQPQCMLLFGDVGIGKTRLAEEVSRDAKKRGWAVAWSRVYVQESNIPYRLWTEVLRKAMAQGAWQRQELSNRPLVFQPLSMLLPDLRIPQVSFAAAQSPEQEQLRLWEAVRELLVVISESTPLLIALDDLQWADGSSCELFAYLARRLQGHQIIIVGTCRENELAANHPLRPLLTDLQRENAVETIALPPLKDEQIDAIVANVPDLPEPLVERIRTRAAGNPFFAEELARTADEASSSDPLPDTITAVLDLRLNRLSDACRRLLSKAAVLGGAFEFRIINAMEAITPASNEDVVLELLEEALRSGMLTEEGTGTRITYHFWHPLLVSHLYERLSAARRASLHRRAAEVLRQFYRNREEEGAATITHHLVQGGADAQQIAHYAKLAGNQAYSLSSYAEAEQHYRTALEHLPPSSAEDESSTVSLSDEQLKLADLFVRLGECTRFQGKFELARGYYEQALKIHSQVGDVRSNKQEAQIQALLWCEIGWAWNCLGDNVQTRHCYQQAERVLREADAIIRGPAWAYLRYQQSRVSGRAGAYEEAQRSAQEALELFEESHREQAYDLAHAPYSTLLSRVLSSDPINLGRTHVLLGLIAASSSQCGEALSHWDKALTLFEQHESQRDIAIVCCDLGDVHMRRADHQLAQSFFRRSLSVSERIGEIPALCIALGNLGILAMRFGNLSEAEEWFRRVNTLGSNMNDPVYLSILLSYLAIILQDQGKLTEAKTNLHRALSIARSMRSAPCIGLALVTLGRLRITQALLTDERAEQATKESMLKRAQTALQRALALEGIEAETRTDGQLSLAQVLLLQGEVDQALRLTEQTLQEAKRFELTWLVARSHRTLGRIFVALGQYAQADQHFEQALRIFRRTGMRLEHGRTLQAFGEALIERKPQADVQDCRGLEYLQEAKKVFAECQAKQDVHMVECVLAKYDQVSQV